jgi:ATP-binding cassette subfamily B multidrug efflux pump
MLRWFERRLDPYPGGDPVEPPKGLLAFCLHYSHGAKKWLALMAFAAAAVAAGEIIIFGFIGDVVNWLAGANPETFLQTDGWKLALMGAMIVFVLPGLALVSTLTMHQTLLGNFPQRIRWMSHRYLIRQSMSYFQDEFAGRIGAKLMQTSLAVREVVMKLLDMLVYVVVYFTGAVILAAAADWRLAIPFLVWLAAYVSMMVYFIPRMGKISQAQADARSLMTGRIALLLASVGGVGIWLWMQGLMTPGALAVSLGLVMRFQGMSQWVMWEMSSLFENIGTVKDGISSISLPRVVSDSKEAKPIGTVTGDIKFENVSFHYGKKAGVIDNLNLHIRPGEKIGLVGRSGAGKSTIVNLLLRFYDRADGKILIDGHDIAQVTQDSLRANIGVVTQDTSLLHRSVRENILYGRPDATEEMMREAADLAEATAFIAGLSDPKGRKGFDAHVGERGVKLSGGQRQRIAIARVLLKNAPILVLDEATSALDSEVEAAIQGQLQLLMKGKTVIAIAHRLSTIAMMDRLVVLDQGRVVESGTHAQLLQTGGIYSSLWNRQSGGFIDADQPEEAAQ